MAQARKYLDPQVLSKLANMELVARCAMEGLYSGRHPSPFHGFSVEYSDHRDYQPGDELKCLDWKMYGRSDKLYIKQFLQETNLTVYILLDSSSFVPTVKQYWHNDEGSGGIRPLVFCLKEMLLVQ